MLTSDIGVIKISVEGDKDMGMAISIKISDMVAISQMPEEAKISRIVVVIKIRSIACLP